MHGSFDKPEGFVRAGSVLQDDRTAHRRGSVGTSAPDVKEAGIWRDGAVACDFEGVKGLGGEWAKKALSTAHPFTC